MKRKITSMTHYQFIEALTLYYCKSFGKPSIQKQRVTSKLTEIVRFDRKNHMIAPCSQAKSCQQYKGRASYACQKCNVGLHPKCFKVYHMDT